MTHNEEMAAADKLRSATDTTKLSRIWFEMIDHLADRDPARARLRKVFAAQIQKLGALREA